MMNGIYAMAASFEGSFFVDLAKELLEGICGCCKSLIELMSSNVKPLTISAGISTSISSVSSTIATLLVMIELCSQAMGFHFDDINDAVRFAFKVVVYKIIIENSPKIVKGVYGMFIDESSWSEVANGFDQIKSSFNNTISNMSQDFQTLQNNGDWLLGIKSFIMGILIVGFVIFICIILIKIMASIAGLLFELAINIAIAPVPLATLVNSQTRQIGIGFIKGFAGNCLTLTMYSLCFNIYNSISGSITSAFGQLIPESNIDFKIFGGLIAAVVGIVLLSTAVNNTSTMINKILS